MRLHVGIDDTDSRLGGCTTHVAAVLVEGLARLNCRFVDYPNIIRLNPNIPYKTRGNAAVALRFESADDQYDRVENLLITTIEKYSRIGEARTDPALVILRGEPNYQIRRVSHSALHGVVPVRDAIRALKQSGAVAASYGAKLGVVGAVAAVGETLHADHTFELVAYRNERFYGRTRRVDAESVRRMDEQTLDSTFNSYDSDSKRVLITPHGPDPVLLGIRGETAAAVLRAFRMLRIQEPVERWVIFRTNHGTDSHLPRKGMKIRSYSPATFTGVVSRNPRRIRGGHVFFSIRRGEEELKCAAFEPTGKFRNIIAQLNKGDEVTAYGGIHHTSERTINLEKVLIRRLAEHELIRNPLCSKCGKRLKSAGSDTGFKCVRCGFRDRRSGRVSSAEVRTSIVGLHVPDLKAHRHLTKPLCRYGREKTWNRQPPVGIWHQP